MKIVLIPSKLRKAFLSEIVLVPRRAIAFLAVVLLLLLPILTRDPYIMVILIYASIFAIYAVSWDVLAGFTGQFSLGHGALFAIGAYSAALLNTKLGWTPWITVPSSTLITVALGLIIAVPSLRLRGIYFSLVSMTLPLILGGVVLLFGDFTGGEKGISGVSAISSNRMLVAYITITIMLISTFIMWSFTNVRSTYVRTGLAFKAIMGNEITARCTGIDTTKYKFLAFGISAFFAGLSGALYVHTIRVAGPMLLDLFWSFNPVIWTLFGGIGTIGGSLIGVFVIYPILESLRIVYEYRMLIYAILVILIMLYMPEGLVPWAIDKIEKECPRCKLINFKRRKFCRVCEANLYREKTIDNQQ